MKNLLLGAAAACFLTACASSGQTASNEPADMPEYTTGSIIAQKSKSKPANNVQTAPAETLGEIRRNSPIRMR